MILIDVPTLNGGVVHIGAASVLRVTRSLHDGGAALTRINLAGDEQLTREPADAVVAALRAAGVSLPAFTAPDGTPVYVNADAVAAVREPDPHRDPPGTGAVLTGSGFQQAIRETPDAVRRAIHPA